ncbi:hydrolytic protein [Micromonospora sp. HM5-17]|jgi:hypothetical protein|uniref:COG1470 family protein n=1 Tax=Micromonospora sp. HM5-17 TaxID=2487710 RepID=UPI000F4674A6|nr:hydrolytic protein [Micromonospora sp. HM5-17]ROT29447.1 hydrolytic protein [Micromonospora sp. HM5-17]
MSISLGLDAAVVVPGESVEIPVTVRNQGDVVEAYDLEIVGVPATWATFDPPRVSLYPGASQTVTLTIRPPRSSEVRAGELPYGVRVVPSEAPQAATVEEGTLTIAPFSEVTAELRPQVRRARLGARYRLAGVNAGNVEETLTLTAVDGTEQLRFAPRPRTTTLAAGEQYAAVLGVRARRLLWRGTPRHLPFRAVVADTGGRAVTLDGTLVQQPVLSAWLLKLVALLLALILLLLALWLGLLRPAVRSAAREAVDEKVAQVATEAEEAASEAAGEAVRDAIEQERAAAPAVPSPSPEAVGGGGDGTDRGGQFATALVVRTNPGGTASRSYTVPRGRVLLITDFLVDNPQGDTGTLTVTANDVRVVTYGLENFRNQDYHSVTPIRVPAGARVTLTVSCRQPGTPAGAPAPRTCQEGLYLNGTLIRAAGTGS